MVFKRSSRLSMIWSLPNIATTLDSALTLCSPARSSKTVAFPPRLLIEYNSNKNASSAAHQKLVGAADIIRCQLLVVNSAKKRKNIK
ncbi:Protein of unknown function [Pyronema omphalodes CBS 100304]|uniref:Uncharacterized protein n=1 Tax=Pyronema omphalodes (strain CBS 100304) TaxID=1076935 RepID=U4LB03_PYROM|nr:Protein of unknown function [Pyronema omphalodes CBS 100304]